MSRRSVSRALAAALGVCTVACGGAPLPPPDGGAGRHAGPPARVEPTLAELEALGYASHAEPEHAGEPASGVTVRDDARLAPGLVLTTDERDHCYALAPDGRLARSWAHPWPVAGRDVRTARRRRGPRALRRRRLDPPSTRARERSGASTSPAHHELAPAKRGGWLVPVWTVREYAGREVRFDEVVHVSTDGDVRAVCSLWELRDTLREHHEPTALDTPPRRSGRNDVRLLPPERDPGAPPVVRSLRGTRASAPGISCCPCAT